MKFFPKQSITTKILLALILTGFLPVVVMSIANYLVSESALRKQVEITLTNVAEDKGERIEAYVRQLGRDIGSLGNGMEVANAITILTANPNTPVEAPSNQPPGQIGGGGQGAAPPGGTRPIAPFMRDFIRRYGYPNIMLFSVDGTPLFSANPSRDTNPQGFAEVFKSDTLKKTVARALKGEEAKLSNFEKIADTLEFRAYVAAPVLRNTQIIGVVSIQINSPQIARLISDYRALGDTGEILITSNHDQNEVSYITPTRFTPSITSLVKPSPDTPPFFAAQGISGQGVFNDYRDKEVFATWRNLPTSGLGLTVKQDTAEAFAPINSQRFALIVITSIVVVLILGVGVLLARSISKPILQLTHAARRVSNGDLDQQVPVTGKDEVGELTLAFNRMTGDLKNSYENIEQTVELRTAELQTANQKLEEEIIERKRTEEALKVARSVAEDASRAKSEFLATMSHEIRTPLNGVIGMTGLLLDSRLNHEQKEMAEVIRQSGEVLLSVINDILDFSKIEAGKLELEENPFELRECVESTLELLAVRAGDKNIEMVLLMDPVVPEFIVGDVTRLRQVLVNLLSNALKFTEKGEIVVNVKLSGQKPQNPDDYHEILFSVRDTGIGIPADKLGKLFQSFSQVDASTTRKYGGTGLGLAISKHLTEMMGGTIWVESQPGAGSTFYFTLKVKPASVALKPVKELEQNVLAGKHLLIVDDNATNRQVLKMQLESWSVGSHEVVGAIEALELLRGAHSFDGVLLDMQMPDMDGVQLAQAIRENWHLPLILLSSLGKRELPPTSAGLFTATLSKPVKASQLFNVLITVFGGTALAVESKPSKPTIEVLADSLPLSILLAEDNAVNQKLGVSLLAKMGYHADLAANGQEAIEALLIRHYDVILMDVQMPEMDGLQATHYIREHLIDRPQPYIIAMTANALKGDREACIAAGMNDYVSKPVQVQELIAALKRAGVDTMRELAPVVTFKTYTNGHSPVVLDRAVVDEIRQFQIVGEPDVVMGLFQAFQLETPGTIEQIKVAISEKDALQLNKAAHKLKGSCYSIGAMEMGDLSLDLEKQGESGDFTGVAEILEKLESAHLRLVSAFELELGRVG
jgi:signal transduction histidine kinase/CheY-like chemotaxis protein/HPt (histidine-containing phosphotransfer) domain-containing protein